jgi:quercetin dioxygenase-like cupin family protein
MSVNGVVVAIITAALSVSTAIADETAAGDDQYRKVLHEAILDGSGEAEVLVREHVYPPGWQAPTHHHDGDLFIYVISGGFEISTEESGVILYGPGQAMQMAAGTTMDARNASDTELLKLVIFQVGEPGKPFLVPTEQENPQ